MLLCLRFHAAAAADWPALLADPAKTCSSSSSGSLTWLFLCCRENTDRGGRPEEGSRRGRAAADGAAASTLGRCLGVWLSSCLLGIPCTLYLRILLLLPTI